MQNAAQIAHNMNW